MATPGVSGGGEFFHVVMGLSDVQDINVELHYRVSECAHFVDETALVKGIVSIECGGLEPVGVDNIAREGGVYWDA